MKQILTNITELGIRFKKQLIVLAAALVLLLPFLFDNPFYQDLMIMVFFWATLALAWNLLGGFAGQISLGHAAFFGIGAYTSTILYLTFGISPWIGMIAGAGISVVVALALGYPCFRLTSHFFALATLAFGEVLRLLASYWRDLTNGGVGLLIPFDPGIANFIFEDKIVYAYIMLAMLFCILIITYLFSRSRFGYRLIALREDQDAAGKSRRQYASLQDDGPAYQRCFHIHGRHILCAVFRVYRSRYRLFFVALPATGPAVDHRRGRNRFRPDSRRCLPDPSGRLPAGLAGGPFLPV